ncbi:MAG: radical SAM protein [Synergistaceae bacterium]|jgi:anaerobic ribonucleoside-triphosphate reductase activating protein|nr:radical SAM protein [Synergistaceae bacterium]
MADRLLLHLLHFPVRSLGPGVRTGLWVQGCRRHCPGCIFPEGWDFSEDRAKPLDDVEALLRLYMNRTPAPDGLTISGGEPFDQPEALIGLLRRVRDMGVGDVLIYSGYSLDALLDLCPELPDLAAALVDGPFEMGNKTDSTWRGSSNQNLTIWRTKYSARYEEWEGVEDRRLQLVTDEGRKFLVGIPKQEDVERLKSGIINLGKSYGGCYGTG